jgi:1,4-dihydroxy-2-naphthoate octaprenyltransferase
MRADAEREGASVESAGAPPTNTARGWAKVFRDPPFYLVGVLPFTLGTLLAVKDGHEMSWPIWGLGSVALALVMAMTFLVNEYYDYETDAANVAYNKFSGGSRSLPLGLVERRHVLTAAGVCALVALALGVIIQFVYKTGPLTLALGTLAAVIGYAYTGTPLRLIYRGWGELLIGVSVGWLPVFIGYYLLGGIPEGATVHLMSLPIAFTIIMVIWANEYPDFESDKASGKRNLVVRMGRERATWVYTALGAATIAALVYLGFTYFEGWRRYILALPALLTLDVSTAIQFGAWKEPKRLEKLCFATILLNLGIIVVLLVVNW